jgi:hypothetical protein
VIARSLMIEVSSPPVVEAACLSMDEAINKFAWEASYESAWEASRPSVGTDHVHRRAGRRVYR